MFGRLFCQKRASPSLLCGVGGQQLPPCCDGDLSVLRVGSGLDSGVVLMQLGA